MKFLAILVGIIMLPTIVYPLAITIDVGDYQIDAQATVNINVNKPIVVKNNDEILTLTPDKYELLVTLLNNTFQKKDGVFTVILRIRLHPYAEEYFSEDARPEVKAYWRKVFDKQIDYRDEALYPNVPPR